jgi:4,5-dihydroxyphthalate decarboxylase
MSAKLTIALACWDYDRTRAIADGRVAVDGVELIYQPLVVEETFFRMLRYREFDACEMSLSSYCRSKFLDDPFIAIPVFPSRTFRHGFIFTSEKSGIREPADLIGKRVGCPEYQLTAPVWIRGILQDEYGVPVDSVQYLIGGEEEPGRTEKIALDLPSNIHVEPIGPADTLAEMLASGAIDAMYSARTPSTLGRHGVRRLFTDTVAVERAYFEKTKLFPIMHVIVIRRDVYEKYRWLARALYKAFVSAQRIAYDDLAENAALKTMLPWVNWELANTRALMGDDYWPYGFENNRHVLDTFTRYSYEQGLSKRKLDPAELFAPETLEAFKI